MTRKEILTIRSYLFTIELSLQDYEKSKATKARKRHLEKAIKQSQYIIRSINGMLKIDDFIDNELAKDDKVDDAKN